MVIKCKVLCRYKMLFSYLYRLTEGYYHTQDLMNTIAIPTLLIPLPKNNLVSFSPPNLNHENVLVSKINSPISNISTAILQKI